ncbi:MAG: IS3 family transposase [Streptomyces sp.]
MSFYYWRRTAATRAARQAAEAQLAARIRAVHQEPDGTYGAPRITAELRETIGEAVNRKRVARIMRESGIEGVRLRRRHRTTVPDPDAAKAPDLIRRDFTAAKRLRERPPRHTNYAHTSRITRVQDSGSRPAMPHPPRPHPRRGSHAGAGGMSDGVNLGFVGAGAALIAGVGGYAWFRSRRTGEH